ncbi:MAG: glycine cleavage system protein GcvH [Candidatus Fermentithermobacillus carboniphilus]|uniref:Glycine cleavage system H protein n=1 Tax=Candidatus Fermentithermobacillus carboniphilus TaxID=3085328 RepID=A0AAT9LDZ9_9FIRM|nr:MAG: glycine cleavage system protein GcvH [Candidatus Fermentithermobacillus carboniphilus]
MTYPANLKYTKTHEYARVEGNKAYVGITNYAQDQLGDIVFVELPEVGRELKAGEIFATVESVKAVSDCYAPVSGKVIEVNEKIADSPELLNKDPHGEGWICAIEMSDPSELENLMDNVAYEKHASEGGH